MRRILRLLTSSHALFVVALLVRLLYLAAYFDSHPPHPGRYLIGEETGSIAASIAAGNGFSSPLYLPSGPTAWVTPVFPYLLAGVFKIFGTYTLKSSIAIRLLNLVFSALTCYPIFSLARRLFGNFTAPVAGWIWALLPMAVMLPIDWAWDMSLAALMLTVALCLTYSVDDRPDNATWGLLGLVWGFTTLVNAAVLSVFPGCFLFAAYRRRLRGTGWMRSVALAAFSFALTISPWIIRNQILFHGRVQFRSNFGLELWLGNNPDVPDTWTWWLHPLDSPQEHAAFTRLGEVAYVAEKRAAAVAFIKSHPTDVARFQFHRFLETWTGHSDSFADIWAMRRLSLRADLLMNYSLTILTFAGLLLAYRRMRLLSLPLLNVIVFFPIVYYVCHTTARYRHPMDPVLATLSAYAIVWLVQFCCKWESRAADAKTAVCQEAAPVS